MLRLYPAKYVVLIPSENKKSKNNSSQMFEDQLDDDTKTGVAGLVTLLVKLHVITSYSTSSYVRTRKLKWYVHQTPMSFDTATPSARGQVFAPLLSHTASQRAHVVAGAVGVDSDVHQYNRFLERSRFEGEHDWSPCSAYHSHASASLPSTQPMGDEVYIWKTHIASVSRND